MLGFAPLLLFLLLITAPNVAWSEGFVDLYGGTALNRGDVTVKELPPFLRPVSLHRDVAFDPSATFGGRVGAWGDQSMPWLGAALDVSFFRAEGHGIEIPVYSLGALWMLRWPVLTSEEFPNGRLQPYAAIGISVFIVPELKIDFRPDVAERIALWPSLKPGPDVRGGLAWQLSRHFALFTEYRFTRFSVDLGESRTVLTGNPFSGSLALVEVGDGCDHRGGRVRGSVVAS